MDFGKENLQRDKEGVWFVGGRGDKLRNGLSLELVWCGFGSGPDPGRIMSMYRVLSFVWKVYYTRSIVKELSFKCSFVGKRSSTSLKCALKEFFKRNG